ncbi:MAG: hypothetical protein ACRC2T_02675 [Thermoguttaceae bacterium]
MKTTHRSFSFPLPCLFIIICIFLILTDHNWAQQEASYYVHNLSTGDIIISQSSRPLTGSKQGEDLSSRLGSNDWLICKDDSIYFGGQGKRGNSARLLVILSHEFTLTQNEYRNATGENKERLRKRLEIYKSLYARVNALSSRSDTESDLGANENVYSAGAALSENNNIQMLFVFGTLDKEIEETTGVSWSNLGALLRDSGLIDPEQFAKFAPDGTTEKRNVNDTLTHSLDEIDVKVHVLSGNNATPSRIVQKCEQMNSEVGSQGAIMVYIICHGAFVKYSNAEEHSLFPTAKSAADQRAEVILVRKDIMKAINRNKHRFVSLITDACSVEISIPITRPISGAGSLVISSPLIQRLHVPPCFPILLKTAQGIMDIGSASPKDDQNAFGNKRDGLIFTSGFIAVSRLGFTESTFGDNEIISFLKGTQKITTKLMNETKKRQNAEALKQKTQHVYDFKNMNTVENLPNLNSNLDISNL